MIKKMILVTGGKGQLGQCLQEIAAQSTDFQFFFADIEELDITNRRAVAAFFKKNKPSWVVNCAAYTAVDKAESDPVLATKINRDGAKNLAAEAAKLGIPIIHLSTDYVYHNRQNTPFVEGDTESPKGVYAKTKLQGDRAVLKSNPQSLVVRTSWVCSHIGNNFVKTMLRLGAERPTLRVVFDQIGSPTFALDLAEAILSVIQKIENQEVARSEVWGVYHFSNEGVASWYDFAVEIFRLAGIGCRVEPIRSAEYPTPAVRPPFSVLDKSKIKRTFGLAIPHWQVSLSRCLALLQ